MMVEKLLTTRQAAEFLDIPESGIRRYLRKGSLKGYQVGQRWKVPVSALQDFLDERSNQTAGVNGDDEF